MKAVLLLTGIAALSMGVLFTGQGLGYFLWPASSFMIRQIEWAYYGGAIAVIGLLLILIARR